MGWCCGGGGVGEGEPGEKTPRPEYILSAPSHSPYKSNLFNKHIETDGGQNLRAEILMRQVQTVNGPKLSRLGPVRLEQL